MNKIKNTQNIEKITMHPTAYTICELGGDHYLNELEIIFFPNEYYPDYTEIQEWAMKNIDGKVMNIEDVVEAFHKFLSETYEPHQVRVIDRVRNCRTHFDVEVEKA